MPTPRLYYDDPFLLTFTARVVAHGSYQGAPSVLLDRTAFYPEAGGQMADHGALGDARVRDVQVDDAGEVHHLLEGAPPAVGSELTGTIERARRRVHMALHTAQHMLSRALVDVARAETVSSRLGETACTIDVDRDGVPERQVAEAEALVNSVVDDDVAVRAFFPTDAELRALPLRRAPKVTENIRVVDIGGFDVTPCGGTHCTRTAQVGLVRVTSVERYKGKSRVVFTAGPRARGELFAQAEALHGLARELTCGVQDVGAALDKLRRETQAARESLGLARARLAEGDAARLLAQARAKGSALVVASLPDADVEYLRAVGGRVTAEEDAVALLAAPGDEGTSVLVARGAKSAFDCGAFLKRAAAAAGGRGGGRPDRAEGRLPAGVDWESIVAASLTG